jgi:hypothetical protein
MTTLVYLLAGVSILLAIGGLSAYSTSKHPGLLWSSLISIGFAIVAISIPHWWPLVVSFACNLGLRLAGLDPATSRDGQ